jgi:predicted DNA-binding transcriptional regulator AlpA
MPNPKEVAQSTPERLGGSMSGWLDVGGDRHGIVSEARWLSIRQIAGDLGVSSSMAYKWSARGVPWFPRTVRLHNGDIRVRRDWYEQVEHFGAVTARATKCHERAGDEFLSWQPSAPVCRHPKLPLPSRHEPCRQGRPQGRAAPRPSAPRV